VYGRFRESAPVGGKVFIEGVWTGDITRRGKPVEFPVAAGRHSVQVWSSHGGFCSNKVELEIENHGTGRLSCRAKSPPMGLSKLPQQLEGLKQTYNFKSVPQMLSLSQVIDQRT
jgi:hypothetical protein